MKEIQLTRGEVALVSDEDYEKVIAAGKWFCWLSHGYKYAMRHVTLPSGKRTLVQMHRFVMGLEHGDPQMVDHHNRNTLDNQRDNLRVTLDQNQQNVARRKDNGSGYKGVSFHERSAKWQARIRVKGKSICLGFFSTPQAAAEARDEAALLHHGPFACTNKSLGLLPAAKKPAASVVPVKLAA